jgi:hypothetical protein
MNLGWVDLRNIELFVLDSLDPETVSRLLETIKKAIKEDGVLSLTDYGVSLEKYFP